MLNRAETTLRNIRRMQTMLHEIGEIDEAVITDERNEGNIPGYVHRLIRRSLHQIQAQLQRACNAVPAFNSWSGTERAGRPYSWRVVDVSLVIVSAIYRRVMFMMNTYSTYGWWPPNLEQVDPDADDEAGVESEVDSEDDNESYGYRFRRLIYPTQSARGRMISSSRMRVGKRC